MDSSSEAVRYLLRRVTGVSVLEPFVANSAEPQPMDNAEPPPGSCMVWTVGETNRIFYSNRGNSKTLV